MEKAINRLERERRLFEEQPGLCDSVPADIAGSSTGMPTVPSKLLHHPRLTNSRRNPSSMTMTWRRSKLLKLLSQIRGICEARIGNDIDMNSLYENMKSEL